MISPAVALAEHNELTMAPPARAELPMSAHSPTVISSPN
jgi:hypothetical protein